MSALLDLAARVEAATGPDRELDAAIHGMFGDDQRRRALAQIGPFGPAYTRSLDDALKLVPEGWAYAFSSNLIGPGNVAGCQRHKDYAATDATAATPALALTAAFLRARANTPEASHDP